MECQQSLRGLRDELLRRRLPRDYVERVTAELADHFEDIASEEPPGAMDGSAAAKRLGCRALLAGQIVRQFQRGTFCGRHPWLSLIVLPVLIMASGYVAAELAILLLAELFLGLTGGYSSDFWRWTTALTTGTVAYALTYGLPLWLCWWTLGKTRQTARAVPWAWLATSTIVLASSVFRIYVWRVEDGRFCIDSSGATRIAMCWLAEDLPPAHVLWRMLAAGVPSPGFVAEVALLITATAIFLGRWRRAVAGLHSEGASTAEPG